MREIIKQDGHKQWSYLCPDHNNDDILEHVSQVRGSILYDQGKRPHFLKPDNTYADKDGLDSLSHHLLYEANQKIIGGVRITKLSEQNPRLNITSSIAGYKNILKIFDHFAGQNIYEVSRLFLKPEYRQPKNIISLYSGLWHIILHKIKAIDVAICSSGTQEGHHKFLLKTNDARTFPFLSKALWSEQYNDSIQIFYWNTRKAPQKLKKHIHNLFI